jgi:L-amino acid N-acyltransferase YncA
VSDRIRLAEAADAGEIAAIYRPFVEQSAISFELEPPDAAAMARRIATTLQRTPWLVFERAGAVAGYAYASKHRERAAYQWSVEVSAYVREDLRRGGVARRLYETLFAALAAQNFVNAYAGITLPNDASVGFHKALGFKKVGVYHNIGFKLGRWHDVGWYERPLGNHNVPSGPPIPLPELPPAALTDLLIRI